MLATTDSRTSFLSRAAPCNIVQTFTLNAPALDTARSICADGTGTKTASNPGGTIRGALDGSATLFLGFDDPATVVATATPLNYDNVVLFPTIAR